MKNALVLSTISIALLAPRLASAHCDTLDGPVVKTAAKALETGKVAPVLAWVKAEDEAAIKTAFAETLAVRKLGPAAKELADRYFFETAVRLHRAGEGASYTGLVEGDEVPGRSGQCVRGNARGRHGCLDLRGRGSRHWCGRGGGLQRRSSTPAE